jgi:acyl-coenzyme A synthetase/AMP-(fatty) acid ligase
MIDFLLEAMRAQSDGLAVATGREEIRYDQLLREYERWSERLSSGGIGRDAVVSIEGEYRPSTIAALLACTANNNIVVPLSFDSRSHRDEFLDIAQVEWRIRLDEGGEDLENTGVRASHDHYDRLRESRDPGLVLFTSGSTGANKAAVHNLRLLLEKFRKPRKQLRTIVFLQLDHIGGVNTLFYTLANGGAVIVPPERTPAAVCASIAQHRVELLPTSPTFLNLLLLSREYLQHDVSSLKLVTYGTEPMPESTLAGMREAMPDVSLQQTYGTTELGILRSKSRDSGSLWVRVGGEGYQTKIVDGRLWVKAKSAMLGYLNAPSPFDSEGFVDTGDQVEVDGEWLRILGRKSEIVNVGGNKIYPAEVESVLLEIDGVEDAIVRGERHALTGQIVTATVRLSTDESAADFRVRMRQHCRDRLPAFGVPAKVRLTRESLHNTRFKRLRSSK